MRGMGKDCNTKRDAPNVDRSVLSLVLGGNGKRSPPPNIEDCSTKRDPAKGRQVCPIPGIEGNGTGFPRLIARTFMHKNHIRPRNWQFWLGGVNSGYLRCLGEYVCTAWGNIWYLQDIWLYRLFSWLFLLYVCMTRWVRWWVGDCCRLIRPKRIQSCTCASELLVLYWPLHFNQNVHFI